jgi:superfamily II DNA/RNA helicase
MNITKLKRVIMTKHQIHFCADVRSLHGDISQSRREQILSDFRLGKFHILIATDLAARGLDIPNIRLVIQTEFPSDIEPYIHRAGRTGRAGKNGINILLYIHSKRPLLTTLSTKIGTIIEPIYPPKPPMIEQQTLAGKEKV